MHDSEPSPVVVLRRSKVPLPAPQGLALRRDGLWISFRDVPKLYSLDRTFALAPVADLTGTAWGLVSHGDRLWAVCGSPPDDGRAIHTFDAAGREVAQPVRCPDETGSYLAHDGKSLFLSQWYARCVFRHCPDGTFIEAGRSPRGVCGIATVGGRLALLNTADEESTDYFISMIDPEDPSKAAFDVARVPFRARSLVWTGSEFLTSYREQGEIVALGLPEGEA
jgi:hypothetical protein